MARIAPQNTAQSVPSAMRLSPMEPGWIAVDSSTAQPYSVASAQVGNASSAIGPHFCIADGAGCPCIVTAALLSISGRASSRRLA